MLIVTGTSYLLNQPVVNGVRGNYPTENLIHYSNFGVFGGDVTSYLRQNRDDSILSQEG
jgi:hypothetical protein